MPQVENNIEFELLSFIIKKDKPVGSNSLALKLNTSMATIGRKLYELEHRGYLEKQSNKGRVITQKGKKYFKELESEELRQHKVNELVNGSKVSSEQDLLDILCVRRLLEKEIVSIAAQKITREECKELEKILADQSLEIKYGSLGEMQNLEFHGLLGKISGNKILYQIVNLIMTQSHAYLEFSYIRKKYLSTVTDHKKILNFLLKGDSKGAAESMVQHIDGIINDVKKHYSKRHQ